MTSKPKSVDLLRCCIGQTPSQCIHYIVFIACVMHTFVLPYIRTFLCTVQPVYCVYIRMYERMLLCTMHQSHRLDPRGVGLV